MALADVQYFFAVTASVAFLLLLYGINLSAPAQDTYVDFRYLWQLFAFVDPYLLAGLGVVMAIGLSVLGAAWCVQPLPLLLMRLHDCTSGAYVLSQLPDAVGTV